MPWSSSGSVAAIASRTAWESGLRFPGLFSVSLATASAGKSSSTSPPASSLGSRPANPISGASLLIGPGAYVRPTGRAASFPRPEYRER